MVLLLVVAYDFSNIKSTIQIVILFYFNIKNNTIGVCSQIVVVLFIRSLALLQANSGDVALIPKKLNLCIVLFFTY